MKNKKDAYGAFITGKQFCPICNGRMKHTEGLLDWECTKCWAEGSTEYDDVNKEYYIKVAKEYSYEELFVKTVMDIPECCKACGGPFPDCMSSCKIFDN